MILKHVLTIGNVDDISKLYIFDNFWNVEHISKLYIFDNFGSLDCPSVFIYHSNALRTLKHKWYGHINYILWQHHWGSFYKYTSSHTLAPCSLLIVSPCVVYFLILSLGSSTSWLPIFMNSKDVLKFYFLKIKSEVCNMILAFKTLVKNKSKH